MELQQAEATYDIARRLHQHCCTIVRRATKSGERPLTDGEVFEIDYFKDLAERAHRRIQVLLGH